MNIAPGYLHIHYTIFPESSMMNSTDRLRERMMRFVACITMALLCFTAQAVFAQEYEPDGYDFEVSDFPPEAFPITLDVTFQNGATHQVVIEQNGTTRLTAQYGLVTSINVTTSLEGGAWFINDPPGPTLPHRVYPGQWPWLWCLHVWSEWVQYYDHALQRMVRFQLERMTYAPC